MTFCVAFAQPRFALVAGDTRGWIEGAAGHRVIDGVRKITPLMGGWCVTGNRVDISAAVERAIAPCDAADLGGISARLAQLRPILLQRRYELPNPDMRGILSQTN